MKPVKRHCVDCGAPLPRSRGNNKSERCHPCSCRRNSLKQHSKKNYRPPYFHGVLEPCPKQFGECTSQFVIARISENGGSKKIPVVFCTEDAVCKKGKANG